jgi:hypothetical protein
MSEQEAPGPLRKRWSALRNTVLFVPELDQLTVTPSECHHEAVEFVRVAPEDEEVMVPEAPHVSSIDVASYSAWSADEDDQLRMWNLAGSAIAGNKVTRTCPECEGTRRLTCSRCHGRGWVDCTWCHGSGHRSCSSCGGAGGRHVSSTSTNADGSTTTTSNWERCGSCGGDGRQRCMSCMGTGRDRCSRCGGMGEVTCETCCEAGTVDYYIRRTFVARTVETVVLPVQLPGFPEPVVLSPAHVHLHERERPVPFDSVADRVRLEERRVAVPGARLFFERQATTRAHAVRDPHTAQTAATFIDGEPEPILTLHRTVADPSWTPDRERRKSLWAFYLYLMAPLVTVGVIVAGQPWIGAGLGVASLAGALWLNRNPVQAFRRAFVSLQCKRHSQAAPMRCPECRADLCQDCLTPSVRCPECGHTVTEAVTHLLEDGRWVDATVPRRASGPHPSRGTSE